MCAFGGFTCEDNSFIDLYGVFEMNDKTGLTLLSKSRFWTFPFFSNLNFMFPEESESLDKQVRISISTKISPFTHSHNMLESVVNPCVTTVFQEDILKTKLTKIF